MTGRLSTFAMADRNRLAHAISRVITAWLCFQLSCYACGEPREEKTGRVYSDVNQRQREGVGCRSSRATGARRRYLAVVMQDVLRVVSVGGSM
ncbi:hypothetical protein LZ32DRAFT_125638 [Colletotrichum eremochloae]|nr:hypothetical protein LZ32DRAFT_125638 [Colletotrichum eremochloae]